MEQRTRADLDEKHWSSTVDEATRLYSVSVEDIVVSKGDNLSFGISVQPSTSLSAAPVRRSAHSRAIPLTEDIVAAAEPRAREYFLRDDAMPGLVLRIRPSGAKTYYARGIGAASEGRRRVCLGSTSKMTLVDARSLVRQMLSGAEAQFSRRATISRRISVAAAIAEYEQARLNACSAPWRTRVRKLFIEHLVREFGDVEVRRLRRAELMNKIRLVAACHPAGANILHKALKALLWWCVERGIVEANVLARTPLPVPAKGRSRALSLADVATLYRAAGQVRAPFCAIFRMSILLDAPINAIRQMEWADIDLDNAVWLTRTEELASPHRALAPAALSLFPVPQPWARHVFPSRRNRAGKPIAVPQAVVDQWLAAAGMQCELHALRRAVSSLRHGRAGSLENWACLLVAATSDADAKVREADDVVL